MPLVSRSQAAYLKDHKPELFKEFAAATPKGTKLPYKAKKRPVRKIKPKVYA